MCEWMYEKCSDNRETLSKKCLALSVNPILFATLFSIYFKCLFHERFSSKRTPEVLCNMHFYLLVINTKLWNSKYFVSPIFRESLFDINQSLIFFNTSVTVEKSFRIFLCSWKKFVWSANVMGFSILEEFGRSFIWTKNTNGQWMKSCGTHAQFIHPLGYY